MAKQLAILLLSALLLSGCSRNIRLYPVQGPQSELTPVPIFVVKLTGAISSGNFSGTLPEGEVFQGKWAQVHPPKSSNSRTAVIPTPSEMATAWDTVYGQGFYVGHVLGANQFAQALVTGDKGTTLKLEMIATRLGSNGASEIRGVAKDSKGNLYKVAG